MIYLEVVFQVVPSNKVGEALKIFEERIFKKEKELIEQVGGKYIGVWTTDIGNIGEITMMVAYPDMVARENFHRAFTQDSEILNTLADFRALASSATVRILRPSSVCSP